MRKIVSAIGLFCALGGFSGAQVRLSPLFTDNMVLQRESSVPVWGRAVPGRNVEIRVSWSTDLYSAIADAGGKWSMKISTPAAGGPHTMRIDDGKRPVTLKNIMSGDVWLCSGQSNMEMPVRGWGKVNDYEAEEKDAANYPVVRFMSVHRSFAASPQEDFKAYGDGWQICSPETVSNFSAAAYFFGREIYKRHKVPVGLINSSYGGTCIEAWISEGAISTLASEQAFIAQAHEMAKVRSRMDSLVQKWNSDILAADRGMRGARPLWASAGFDDSGWKEIRVPGTINNQGLKDFDGLLWLRKEVTIPSSWAGKEIFLCLETIDDNDFTYFNGHQVGATEGFNFERKYAVPRKYVKAGRAVIAVRCIDVKENGGIIGDQDKLALRCGEQTLSLAGTWKYEVGSSNEDTDALPPNKYRVDYPTHLYNAMIHPLHPYQVKGVLWYQGETNASAAYQYRETLPLLIADWREKWGCNLPFYVVQLANYMAVQTSAEEKSAWAELREAQWLSTRTVDNAYMSVSIDIGDAQDVHPKNKQEVGRRLALLAGKYSYGEDSDADSPCFDSYTIEGSSVRIRFSNADGLKTSDGGPVRGFVIAGGDHKFHFAQAVIEGSSVVVSCPGVKYPQAVRYGWANNPVCNLCNGAGLPAGPFRTDCMPGVTFGKRRKN